MDNMTNMIKAHYFDFDSGILRLEKESHIWHVSKSLRGKIKKGDVVRVLTKEFDEEQVENMVKRKVFVVEVFRENDGRIRNQYGLVKSVLTDDELKKLNSQNLKKVISQNPKPKKICLNTIKARHYSMINGEMVVNNNKDYFWHIPKAIRAESIKSGDIVLVVSQGKKAKVLVIDVFMENFVEIKRKYRPVLLKLKWENR